MCAQVLLPAASTDEKSLLARLERLESGRRGTPGPLPVSAPRPPRSGTDDSAERPRVTAAPDRKAAAKPAETAAPASTPVATPPATDPALGLSAADSLRKNWDAVLEAVMQERKVAWLLLRNASVLSLEDKILTLQFPRDGDLKGFGVSGHDAILKRVLNARFGLDVTIRGVTGADAGTGPARGPAAAVPARPAARPRHDEPPADEIPPDDTPPDEPEGDAAPAATELTGMDLIQRELGGRVIGEFED